MSGMPDKEESENWRSLWEWTRTSYDDTDGQPPSEEGSFAEDLPPDGYSSY